jgi:hypothetical protein
VHRNDQPFCLPLIRMDPGRDAPSISDMTLAAATVRPHSRSSRYFAYFAFLLSGRDAARPAAVPRQQRKSQTRSTQRTAKNANGFDTERMFGSKPRHYTNRAVIVPSGP